MRVWKIQRADGKFSEGGRRWGKIGKLWQRRGDVSLHLRAVLNFFRFQAPSYTKVFYSPEEVLAQIQPGTVLVEYELVERSRTPLGDAALRLMK